MGKGEGGEGKGGKEGGSIIATHNVMIALR